MTNEDTYPNAGRASGYTDDDAQPVGENVVNVVTGIVTAAQTKWVLDAAKLAAQLKETGDRLNDTAKMQDQQYHYILGEITALYKKEDKRHEIYDTVLAKTENDTVAALTSVAHRLDEITSYVQQSVTIAREGIAIGKEALTVGREARATGKEALAIAKANAAQMITLKKAVVVLEKGQAASKKQWKEVLDLLADSKTDRADLRQRIDALSIIVDEHHRYTAQQEILAQEVADLRERIDRLEHGGG